MRWAPAPMPARSHAATAHFEAGSGAAGNGSLMRTTPLVLGYLDDPAGLAEVARVYSHLTHGDPDAADACVLWNLAQRHAILQATFDVTVGLEFLPADRRGVWEQRIAVAEAGEPRDFTAKNGWSVGALQCAWSAIVNAVADGPGHFEAALRLAVAAGHDTDTVAAIAGGLLGARWGVSAIPLQWRRRIFGWPGLRGQDLVRTSQEVLDGQPWPARFNEGLAAMPAPIRLPQDPGVWLGDIFGLADLPADVTAVVSLCRLGTEQVPRGIAMDKQIEVWLIDSTDENPHLGHVVDQTVDLVQHLRDQGEVVYLHCVQARSRTPLIAAAYAARRTGEPGPHALEQVAAVLPQAHPNPAFLRYLQTV